MLESAIMVLTIVTTLTASTDVIGAFIGSSPIHSIGGRITARFDTTRHTTDIPE